MMESILSVHPFLYLLVPLAFLIGSIPFGIIFTRGKGIDIRSVGSKNIGATNVLRSVGKGPALLTLLGDILKGTAAVAICRITLDAMNYPPESTLLINDFWLGCISVTAVLGHMYSVFLSFRGGKGVATGFGVLFMYTPLVALIMFLIWLSMAYIFRYSSLSALTAFGALPLLLFLTGATGVKIGLGFIITAFIIYKHRANIKNLLAGTESRIGKK